VAFVVALAVAVVVAVVATPVAGAVARRAGVVDRPGPLKTHREPVPYLGGVAVFVALCVGVIATGRPELLAPLLLALALGTVDDVAPLPARVRLVVEAGVGVTAALVVPGDAAMRIATGVAVVALLNAVNLLDGQDGLAASVGIVSALAFAALGGDATAFGAALAGGLAGFLVFNHPPARIYLGDGGAYLVGTALVLAIPLTEHGASDWAIWFAAPLVVAVPLADTAVAIIRRARTGAGLLVGDRSHVYDQLVDRGCTVTTSTLLCAAAQVLLAALGLVVATFTAPWAFAATVTIGVLLALGAGWAGFLGAGTARAR
jgi:UDP-GlcNAc:undecaprenyl-phosphate GlcNAc-1-phosphate transferase